MRISDGVRQRSLQRITVHWDNHDLTHAAMIPMFRTDYRVFGMVGFGLGLTPIWYPGTPITVTRKVLRYKGGYSETPPSITELDEEIFAGAFYFDPWQMLSPVLASQPGNPHLAAEGNLAARRIGGQPVYDLIFEPPLHRLRGLVFKRRFRRLRAVSMLELHALTDVLDPYIPAMQKTQKQAAVKAGMRGRLMQADGRRIRLDLGTGAAGPVQKRPAQKYMETD